MNSFTHDVDINLSHQSFGQSFSGLLDLQFKRAYTSGAFPYATTMDINRPMSFEELSETKLTLQRACSTSAGTMVLASSDDAIAVVETGTRRTSFRLAAISLESLDRITSTLGQFAVTALETHNVKLWHWSERSAIFETKDLDLMKWSDTSRNYTPAVRHKLNPLFELKSPPTNSGRLLLWHGEPGTGKTSALRSLAYQWSDWCDFHYVVDPENFFRYPDYLYNVLTSASQDAKRDSFGWVPPASNRWRLVVAEDVDEYLTTNAKKEAGAPLGRLLNLTDGIIGQNERVLILLTTNEELKRLHPAITRPGRAMSEVEFTRFDQAEATEWLGRASKGSGSQTLAQLLVESGGITSIDGSAKGEELLSVGAYL